MSRPPPLPPNTLLREWSGPLTADLVRSPGRFGLGQVPAKFAPDATTTMVCGFCSTGCGLNIHLKDGQAVNLSAASEYPVNLGTACPKGWEALAPLAAPDRAVAPLLRGADGTLKPVDWDHALQVFTLRFKAMLDQHGPESIAFLSSGQICTEEMALLGSLFKFGMGGLHCDSNTRQCMATSNVAYRQSLGFDAPPFTYADFEESDVLVFIGSNLCVAHPILWQRVLRNRHRPEIIVIDPRKTETAMAATQHLAIAPKSDLVLLYGIARALLARGAVDRGFVEANTTGFAEFAAFVETFTPEQVLAATRLAPAEFERLVESIAKGQRVSFWWTMGVNQGHESTRTAQAIINLALMTGNIGRPGTGPNSVTGQCNAMGSRLFSNTSGLLGGRDFSNPEHREEVSRLLGVPSARVPTVSSLAYDQIVERVADGRIKALWVIGTNPVHSWMNLPALDAALDRLEFLVVQDLYTTTDTAQRAHLILPAAGWGEKDGTMINSERRLGLVKKVLRAPGQALADFHIFRLIAHYWGCSELFGEWTSPQAAFQILKRLSAGRPCDFTGIEDYRHLDREGGIQWPLPERVPGSGFQVPGSAAGAERAGLPEAGSNQNSVFSVQTDDAAGAEPAEPNTENRKPKTQRERRLFADGKFFTPDGKARFLFDPPRPQPEPPDAEYPFTLLTGRGTSAQWHTLTRTDKSDILKRLGPAELPVEIHPSDARRLGIRPGQTVRVTSRRGSVEAKARITRTISPGQVFLPMHYLGVNRLTFPVVDPHSRQPGYKACAVKITP